MEKSEKQYISLNRTLFICRKITKGTGRAVYGGGAALRRYVQEKIYPHGQAPCPIVCIIVLI